MTSRARAADSLVKVPLRFVHLKGPGARATEGRGRGEGRRGGDLGRGGSLVRFYWSSGEEPLLHGCTLAGKQDSDELSKAAI